MIRLELRGELDRHRACLDVHRRGERLVSLRAQLDAVLSRRERVHEWRQLARRAPVDDQIGRHRRAGRYDHLRRRRLPAGQRVRQGDDREHGWRGDVAGETPRPVRPVPLLAQRLRQSSGTHRPRRRGAVRRDVESALLRGRQGDVVDLDGRQLVRIAGDRRARRLRQVGDDHGGQAVAGRGPCPCRIAVLGSPGGEPGPQPLLLALEFRLELLADPGGELARAEHSSPPHGEAHQIVVQLGCRLVPPRRIVRQRAEDGLLQRFRALRIA